MIGICMKCNFYFVYFDNEIHLYCKRCNQRMDDELCEKYQDMILKAYNKLKSQNVKK